MSKPQILLVPGAWHTPAHFLPLLTALQSHSYTVHTVHLPSVGSDPPPPDLAADIAALRAALEAAIGDANDVVVICHSWGGMVTGSAVAGYSKEEREREGKGGGVVGLGYVAAFMVGVGERLMAGGEGGEDPWWWVRKGQHLFCADPAKLFYNDMPADQQAYYTSKLQPMGAPVMDNGRAEAAAWLHLPVSYLVCTLDEAAPVAAQEAIVAAARAKGAHISVSRVEAGHSPFLSRVEETVEWVRGVAGETVEAS